MKIGPERAALTGTQGNETREVSPLRLYKPENSVKRKVGPKGSSHVGLFFKTVKQSVPTSCMIYEREMESFQVSMELLTLIANLLSHFFSNVFFFIFFLPFSFPPSFSLLLSFFRNIFFPPHPRERARVCTLDVNENYTLSNFSAHSTRGFSSGALEKFKRATDSL